MTTTTITPEIARFQYFLHFLFLHFCSESQVCNAVRHNREGTDNGVTGGNYSMLFCTCVCAASVYQ